MRRQFPTIEKVAVPSSGGVSFRIVMAMKQRFAGEARSAMLAAIASNLRPKTVIVVDPDIDVHSSDQVEWALAFRMQPARDAIIVEGLPSGPLDPSADESLKPDRRTGSAIGFDATFPYGTVIRKAAEAGKVCGPAIAEHGLEYVEVADVPGWQTYDFPELRNRSPS
jgi:2,5-furandicarboxylate decarboxylase 1